MKRSGDRDFTKRGARDAIVRLLDMNGSFPLTDDAVDEMVTRTSPGNYALGYMDGSTFMVSYLGRSDSDLRGRLHDWVGAPSRERYAPDSKAAWASRRCGVMPLAAPAPGPVGVTNGGYTCFAYSYAPSAEAAFAMECRNFDDVGTTGELDNPAHPLPTPGSCA